MHEVYHSEANIEMIESSTADLLTHSRINIPPIELQTADYYHRQSITYGLPSGPPSHQHQSRDLYGYYPHLRAAFIFR